jgi:hypothetical protein
VAQENRSPRQNLDFCRITADAEYGVAFRDLSSAAVVIPADQFLTMELAAEWVTRLSGQHRSVALYYFRSSADFEPTALPAGVTSKRVPFDLGV